MTNTIEEFELVREPRGRLYADLLDFLGRISISCSLVIREPQRLSPKARWILSDLDTVLIKEIEVSSWPGTRLIDNVANLQFYRLPDAIAFLKANSEGLYDWLAPDAPEDLAFWRTESTEILSSCAHEQFADLRLTPAEASALRTQVPGISSILRHQ